MSTYFEGNAFIDGGQVQNTLVTANSISNCIITTSTLDMNLYNITSVLDPINPQDAATKKYVDDLAIVLSNITLTGTSGTVISTSLKGSFIVKVDNLVSNGPSGIFNITKIEANKEAQCNRVSASPGYTSDTTLMISWPPNSSIYLRKTGSDYDGSYNIKFI